MIRRNHIEAVTRIDRHNLRYEPKDINRQSGSKKYVKVECGDLGEQTFRVTSSNKKYHQYKDWKEQYKTKHNQPERKEALRFAQYLSEFQTTNQNQCLNSLKRNYDRETQQKAFNFNSVREYERAQFGKQNAIDIHKRKRMSQHHYRQSQPYSSEIRQNLQLQKPQTIQPQKNIQTFSPSKRSQNYVSTQKYQQSKYPSSNKYYPPLFDSSLHNKSINRWQRSQVQSSAKAPGKIAYYQNSIKSKKQDTSRNSIVRGFEGEKGNKYVIEDKKEVKRLPLNKIENEGQEVSEKLKKISQFNDQINQRIKNIISCFETLKGKF